MNGRGFGPRPAGTAVMVATVLATAACGGTDTPATPAPQATTTVAPAPAATTPSATVESIPSATVTSTRAAAPAATVKVPNGVGLDYQSAQDLWRAAGLIVAPAEDASGANRIPVLDANWTVVAQNPKAGRTVDVGSLIKATVKKNSD